MWRQGGWVPVVCRGLGVLYMLFILVKQLRGMGVWLFITYAIQPNTLGSFSSARLLLVLTKAS